MTGGIIIKRAAASDWMAFKQIRLEALKTEGENFGSAYEEEINLTEEGWRHRLEIPVFLAFRGEEPVGVVGLLRERGVKVNHRALVIMVYLRKDVRGTGLAKRLLDTVVEQASQDGVRQLELHVRAENAAAIRLYEREGFVEIGRIPAATIFDGREVDEFLMCRRL
ncbi:RimJ/RimL family protein N-acetyltransferase [Rhizobium aquaticum]|uniref:RimJ/RimL family protein N-acetyltransferase n=1 Tax=Rhizobium aquaticum TaxID=1549636 RepID=A0ABV2IY96_9HYPH